MGKQFSPRHVSAVATLVAFTESRQIMLKATPIADNPSLFERSQDHQDSLYDQAMKTAGHVHDQHDSVILDNLVCDELDRRRDHRRAVIAHKRAFLASGFQF